MTWKIIFLLIVTVAFVGQTINDWSTLDSLGKLFMILLDLGFAGLTYKEFNK